MNTHLADHKVNIGWREWIALPELKIPAIKSKIDTGTRTSAICAFDVNLLEIDGRKKSDLASARCSAVLI